MHTYIISYLHDMPITVLSANESKFPCIHTHPHIHTYIHIFVHMCRINLLRFIQQMWKLLHAYTHTHPRTYVHTYIRSYVQDTPITLHSATLETFHACMHAYIFVHTYIHAYIYSFIYAG